MNKPTYSINVLTEHIQSVHQAEALASLPSQKELVPSHTSWAANMHVQVSAKI
jgi:hypothetical protein